jgi:flagellar FliL protein
MADKNDKDKKVEEDDDKKEKQPLTIKKVVIIMSAAFALIMLVTIISLVLILKKSSSTTNTSSTPEQTIEKKQTDNTKDTNQTETKKETKEEARDNATLPDGKKQAIFYTIKPVFVVNINSARVKFLQINVDVMVRSLEVVNKLTNNLPLIKNELLILFSNKNYDEVKTLEGREALRREALKVVRNVIEKETGSNAGIEDVLFTGFVVQ